MTKGGGGGLSVVIRHAGLFVTHTMSYAGQCAVCDGHCWDDYSAVDCRMTVALAVELMLQTYIDCRPIM